MKLLPMKAASVIFGNYDVTYPIQVPNDLIGCTVLVLPPEDVTLKDIRMINIGVIHLEGGWVNVKYDMIPSVSRGNVKKYKANEVVANFLVIEDGVEDYKQLDYDEGDCPS